MPPKSVVMDQGGIVFDTIVEGEVVQIDFEAESAEDNAGESEEAGYRGGHFVNIFDCLHEGEERDVLAIMWSTKAWSGGWEQ